MRIAICDDDPESLELLELALTGFEVDLERATDGGALVELIAERGPFDLIVTDVGLPCMSGLHVVAALRAVGIETPVLMITGLDRCDLEGRALRLNHAALLRKPVSIPELRRAVISARGGERAL
jgi:CheY-like chemotaxis protein